MKERKEQVIKPDRKQQKIIKNFTKAKKIVKKQKQRKLKNIAQQNWYKLDNSALIYPAISSSEWNSVFRISASLNQDVNPVLLQTALDQTINRFPFYNVSLREGVFWHYFQGLAENPKVELETQYPCRPINFTKHEHVFRVLYYKNRISFETFHSLTDGFGGTQFLNTLLTAYTELLGIEVIDKQEYGYNVFDKSTKDESEDAFRRYADPKITRGRKESKAYAIVGDIEPIDVLKIFTATISVEEIKKLAHNYNATINEFLSAVYLQSLIQSKKESKKQSKLPVKLSVPANIRRRFPSKTMRNFSLVLNLEIPVKEEDATLEQIIGMVKEQMKALNDDYIRGFIGSNMADEKNIFVRLIPLFLKNILLKIIYLKVGESRFTSTISNLGVVKLPAEVSNIVTDYQCFIGATKLNKSNIAVITNGDKLSLSMSSRLKDNSLAQDFFSRLANLGLNIRLQSNI